MTQTQATTAFSLARDSLQANESSARLGRFRRRGYQRYRLVSSQIDLSMVWKRRWFIISMLLGFALMSAPTPSGLTHQGQIVLCMSIMATILFVTEAIPLPTVPLLIIVGEVLLLKVDATKVAQSLMTDSVLFIMGKTRPGCGHQNVPGLMFLLTDFRVLKPFFSNVFYEIPMKLIWAKQHLNHHVLDNHF